ncbi:AMP-binding protein [Flavobacteriaceae bacterium]|nr:AMP-binding protein [Flavobacteriaceae bacterium]
MSNETIFDFKFYHWEKTFKNKTFLRQPFGENWEEYTWGEAGQLARKLATGLKSLGLPEKSHIGLMSKNCREWVIADLAIVMAGYVSVPFFPNLNSSETKSLLNQGDVKALFMGKVEDWSEIKKGVPKEMPMITFPHYKGFSEINEGFQWLDFINKFDPQTEDYSPNINDIWTIIFTSGTTGAPKGVVLDFGTVQGTWDLFDKNHNPLEINFLGKNSWFSFLPLNHIAERVGVEYTCIRHGGVISFTESLEKFSENLKSVQPSIFIGVPRLYTKFQMGILSKFSQKKLDLFLSIPIVSSIIKNKLKKALGLSNAKSIISGAAPMLEVQKQWYKKIGINITNIYGMTENCAICTQIPASVTNKINSVGLPQSGVKIKINPENNEIMMSGSFVMKGYYKDKVRTDETIKDGWLCTGDQGRIDEDGYLYITGRVKDTFKTSKGEFIEPLGLEKLFGDTVEFEQICIVGLGNPQPMLLAILSELGKSMDKNKLKSIIEKKLAAVNKDLLNYKRISTIIMVKDDWNPENEILTPTMKIKRNKINDKYCEKFRDWNENKETVIWE